MANTGVMWSSLGHNARQFDNVPHNRLLVAALHAFGIDAETFGKTDTGKGPLTGLLA